MADIAIFRINYKSDFILTLQSDAGWMTPFCIKFWTGAPSQAYYAYYDGMNYTHCAPVEGEPTKIVVQFDDHHLPVGDLMFQISYHFTVADFPTSVEDEVLNQASVIIEQDGEPAQVMLDFNGETAPEIEFSLPAYANEAQRITNEQARIAAEQQRIANENARIQAEETRQQNEQQRVQEFGQMRGYLEQTTRDAAAAAENANEKGVYAKNQGDYAKQQGDYAKQQGDTAKADHERAEDDHRIAGEDHTQAGSDHTRAGEDHAQAGSDHTRAGEDHTRAGDDHTRADQDHTRAESDHAAVEVYVDSLGAFDISSYHATGGELAKYADLTAALGNGGANIPEALRKGGMSVKFVQNSDNKYVQYRYMETVTTAATFTNVANWQGVDVHLTAGSKNFVESGEVYNVTNSLHIQAVKLTDRLYGTEGGTIDLTNIEAHRGYIYNGKYRITPTDSYSYKIIEVEAGKKIRATGNGSYNGGIIFLKSYPDSIVSDETPVDFCDGTPGYTIDKGAFVDIIIPDDCVYMYVKVKKSGNNIEVASVEYLEEEGDIPAIEDNIAGLQDDVSNIESQVNTLDSDIQDTEDALFTGKYLYRTISDSDDLVTGKYWKKASGIISLEDSSSYLGCTAIECKKGDEFKITSLNSYTYVVDVNFGVIRQISNPQSVSEELTVVIDSDTAKYICSNVYHSAKTIFKVKKKYRETYIDIVDAELNDEVLQNEYAYEVIADSDSLSENQNYYQVESGKAVLEEGTGNYRGAEVTCAKGEVFEIYTLNSKTYITTDDGTILRTINNPSSTDPLNVEITEDDAYYIRTNCYTSARPYFSIQRRYIQSRIDRIEDDVKRLTSNNLKSKSALLLGASFAYAENGWYEIGCSRLDIKAVNKAVAGSSIKDSASDFLNNVVGTTPISEAVANNDVLVIMHVHNINVNALPDEYKDYTVADYEADDDFIASMSASGASAEAYSEAYDYVIKKWISLCYAERENSSSPWYNTQHGKPAVIVACTSWHDARQVFNTAIEELAGKWGMHLCDFAKNVGFSCQELDPATGGQTSILFAQDTQSLSFDMQGERVTQIVGWHPLRGRSQYIQQRLGMIFYETLRKCIW